MKITTKETVQKFINKHGNTYDYADVLYTNAKTKVKVLCKEHGIFLITPNNHLTGHGCPKCKGRGFNKEERIQNFIKKAKNIHGDVYDYSSVTFSNNRFYINCTKHGIFSHTYSNHISNRTGCKHCNNGKQSIQQRLTNEQFITKAINTHGKKYLYNNVKYIGAHIKVIITCPLHGDFKVTPVNHWSNNVGCQSCKSINPSKGEQAIISWLDSYNISYECEKTFKDLYHLNKKAKLRYDFFIPDLDLLIEFDGEYHFNPISFNKNVTPEEQLKVTQLRDGLKTEYAKDNEYHLLRIRYDEDIESSLLTYLSKLLR